MTAIKHDILILGIIKWWVGIFCAYVCLCLSYFVAALDPKSRFEQTHYVLSSPILGNAWLAKLAPHTIFRV